MAENDVEEEVVKVLYQYSYSDDRGPVEMKPGDVFRLIDRTNEEWWQVYDPSDALGESFFVPAKYVEVLNDSSPEKAISHLDRTLLTMANDFDEPNPDSKLNGEKNKSVSQTTEPAQDSRKVSQQSQKSYGQDDPNGVYVNLDVYRGAAGIPCPALSNQEHDYVNSPEESSSQNLALIQGTIPPPLPEEGTFVKVLLEELPWDIYKEKQAKRLFYVNRETGERMWKPPRKPKPSSPTATPVMQTHEIVRTRGVSESSSTSPIQDTQKMGAGIGDEYEQFHDNGSIYFIHKSTQEKEIVAPELNIYVDNLISITKHRDTNWEPQGPRLSTFGGQSLRASKAVSMYGSLDTSSNNSKASTLPANFTVARPAPLASERGYSTSTTLLQPPHSAEPSRANEDMFSGILNKAQITDVGKKKPKKSWRELFVVLKDSNLVFYRDQKASSPKQGHPHGQPDRVVSLQGAHIIQNPAKEYTSKRNTILLKTKSGDMFLFQAENEKKIMEWLTKMKIAANDLSSEPEPDYNPTPSIKEDKKGIQRSTSSTDPISQGVDKNKNQVGLKAKLMNLISRRPTQDDLVKRGIIKDLVFGAKLHELCDRERVRVPKFVHLCIQAVEAKGLTHDGLYRVSGNMAEIQRLRYAVEKDDTYDLYDEQWDIHVLTGSLKYFFRELKEPVYTFNLFNKFLDAIKKVSSKEKMSEFKEAVKSLPRCNYFTLKELYQHLHNVTDMCHKNRMMIQNIAIVFAPTLMWPEKETTSLAVQTVWQSKIVEFMLTEYSQLFDS